MKKRIGLWLAIMLSVSMVCYGALAMASTGAVSVEEVYSVCPQCNSIAEYMGREYGGIVAHTMPGTPCPSHGNAHYAEGMFWTYRDAYRCFACGYSWNNYGEELFSIGCPLDKK